MNTVDTDLEDETLVQRLQEGDRAAFQQLAVRHGGRYRALAYRMMGNMAQAEDLVQEAFVKLWTNASQFDSGRARFTTWFHRVVVNKCLDEKRKRRVETLPDGYDEADIRPLADTMLEQQSANEKLSGALSDLSERQRTAMTLSYLDGLSNLEAAEVMELNIKAYESLLVRSRSNLRKILSADKNDLMATFG